MPRRGLLLAPLVLLAVPLAPVHASPPEPTLPLEPLLEGVPSLDAWARVTLRETRAPPMPVGELTLRAPPGVEIEGDATRTLAGEPGAREASWDVRVVEPGLWRISADGGGRSWCCVYVATDATHAAWGREPEALLPRPDGVRVTAERVGEDRIETTVLVPAAEGVLADQRVKIEARVLGWPETSAIITGRDGATFVRTGAFDPSRCHEAVVLVEPQPVFRGAEHDEQLHLAGWAFSQSFTTGSACGEGKADLSPPIVLGAPRPAEDAPADRQPVSALPLAAALAALGGAAAIRPRRE